MSVTRSLVYGGIAALVTAPIHAYHDIRIALLGVATGVILLIAAGVSA